MSEAVKMFREHVGEECMARPEYFIARWAEALQTTHALFDGHRKGRPRLLGDAEAKAAADLFCKGYKQKGSSNILHYVSLREGISKCPKLRELQERTGAMCVDESKTLE